MKWESVHSIALLLNGGNDQEIVSIQYKIQQPSPGERHYVASAAFVTVVLILQTLSYCGIPLCALMRNEKWFISGTTILVKRMPQIETCSFYNVEMDR